MHPRNRHHWHHCNSTRKSCCRHCCCCLWLVITFGFLLVWFIIYSRNNSNGKFNKLTFLHSFIHFAKKNDLFRQQYFPFTASTSLTILYLMKRKNLRSTICSYLLSIKKNLEKKFENLCQTILGNLHPDHSSSNTNQHQQCVCLLTDHGQELITMCTESLLLYNFKRSTQILHFSHSEVYLPSAALPPLCWRSFRSFSGIPSMPYISISGSPLFGTELGIVLIVSLCTCIQ